MTYSPATHTRRKSRSLTEEVVSSLSEKIRNGEFRPGEKLPTESEIMQIYGVSRTVVREAISQLQAGKLVETRHGIGTFLLEMTRESALQIDTANILTMLDIMAILELRISLETEAAGLAANRRSDADLREMKQALDDFEEHVVKRTGNAIEADLAFHLLVARATGNRYFHDILSQLGNTIIPRTRINSAALADHDQASYLNRVNREHDDIYDAIERRDPEAARAAMRTHLANSRERLRRAHEAASNLQPGSTTD